MIFLLVLMFGGLVACVLGTSVLSARSDSKMLPSSVVSLALVAALLGVATNAQSPVFAAVEDLPPTTGFDCNNGVRGGIPYQMVWGGSNSALFNGGAEVPAGATGTRWQIAGYDANTGSYVNPVTWAPASTGGLVDDNGSVVIPAGTFNGGIVQTNGLIMDPYGNMYFAIQPKNSNTQFVQMMPPAPGQSFGSMRPIATLLGTPTSINSGTYIEVGGEPYALVSKGTLLGQTYLIPLLRDTNAALPAISETNYARSDKTAQKNAKDFSWVKEGISYQGLSYDLIGMVQDGNRSGTIILHQSGGLRNGVAISNITLPELRDANGGLETGDTFGASYNFKYQEENTAVFFSANMSGNFLSVGIPDSAAGQPSVVTGASSFNVTNLGGSVVTTNNDGAGCTYERPPVLGDLVASTWPPTCVTDNPTGAGSTVPILIANQGPTANVFVTATLDGAPVTDWTAVGATNASGVDPLANTLFAVGGNSELVFTIPILKGQVWSVSVTDAAGEALSLIPDGGTLDVATCGDFVESSTWAPTAVVGVCDQDSGPAPWVAVVVDNSASSLDATVEIFVNGGLTTTGTVAAGASTSFATVVSDGQTVAVDVTADGQVTVGASAVSDCPVEASLLAYPCADFSGVIQVRMDAAGDSYETVVLAVAEGGSDQVVWDLPLTATGTGDDAYKGLNGTAISPIDGIAYGLMKFDNAISGEGEQSYLVRFDANQVEFVYETEKWGNNGTFDKDGNFFYAGPEIGTSYPDNTLWTITDPSGVSGFSDRHDAALTLAGTAVGDGVNTWPGQSSDVAHVNADLGLGTDDYIIGLGSKLYFSSATTGATYVVPNLTTTTGTLSSSAFGGAVSNSSGSTVFFSSNTGSGVYQLDTTTIDLNNLDQTIEFVRVAASPLTGNNDGMGCSIDTLPEDFGGVYGYVWVDFDDNGERTSIEDGLEPHVTGYTVTLTNITSYLDSAGNVVFQPGEATYSAALTGTDAGDYKWESTVPCVDNSGNTMSWKASINYDSVTAWPTDFYPDGYTTVSTVGVVDSGVDSDGAGGAGAQLSTAMSGAFVAVCDASTHVADAGIVGTYGVAYEPTATFAVECVAGVTVTLGGEPVIDSLFTVNVYHVDVNGVATLQVGESATQFVAAGDSDAYDTAITIPDADTLLYLVVSAEGSLNGVTNADRYSYEVLTQSANDGVNVLCVAVTAVNMCSDDEPVVTLDNSASVQDATFTVTPVLDGVPQTPSTVLVAGGTVENLTSELGVAEDATWSVIWQVVGGTAGSFGPYQTDTLTLDCVDPIFEPVITITAVCIDGDDVRVSYIVDNSASELSDIDGDPAVDAHTVAVGYADLDLTIDNVVPGASYEGTFTVAENSLVQVWAESLTGTVALIEEIRADSCETYDPVTSLDFECSVGGAVNVTATVDNSGSTVDIETQLVKVFFDGSEVVVANWTPHVAGALNKWSFETSGDSDMEYKLYTKTVNDPATYWPASPALGTGTDVTYTSCGGVPTAFGPYATLAIVCAVAPPTIYVNLDNSGSDFHAEFTVNVFDGPSTSSASNDAASGVQVVSEGSLAVYATEIPVPAPGNLITVQILGTALNTGGETLTATTEIFSQAGVNCPDLFSVNVTTALGCGLNAVDVLLNNEFSSSSAVFALTPVFDGVDQAVISRTVLGGAAGWSTFDVYDGAVWYLKWQVSGAEGSVGYSAETDPQTFVEGTVVACDTQVFTG